MPKVLELQATQILSLLYVSSSSLRSRRGHPLFFLILQNKTYLKTLPRKFLPFKHTALSTQPSEVAGPKIFHWNGLKMEKYSVSINISFIHF